MSLGKGLAARRHFCFVDLLGTVIKTVNVTLTLTGPQFNLLSMESVLWRDHRAIGEGNEDF